MIRLLLLSILLFAGAASEPRMRFTYEEKPQLSWSDFKGIPLDGKPYHASVNSGIGYTFKSQAVNGKTIVATSAQSYFYPEFSWKRNIDESNPALLAHEQLHWDITELHTIMLRKQFKKYVADKNPKDDIRLIFENIESQRKTMQARYDKETSHGRNKDEQSNWEMRVTELRFRI
jgi:hypothetical protein